MNLEETKNVLTVLRINYPASFVHLSKEDSSLLLNEWHRKFENYPVQVVLKAIDTILDTDTSEFAPKIATIKRVINEQVNPETESAELAWDSVKALMPKFMWSIESDRQLYENSLSERTKKVLSFDEIYNMAQSNAADNDQYRKPVFLKAFKDMAASDHQKAIENATANGIGMTKHKEIG